MNYHHSTDCGPALPESLPGNGIYPRFKILVVDGDRVNRGELRSLLTIAGFAARSAGDGVEALRALASSAYDLLVADIALPRVDGRTLVKALRTSGSRMPVVMFSGDAPAEQLPDNLRGLVSAELRRTASCREIIAAAMRALVLESPQPSTLMGNAR